MGGEIMAETEVKTRFSIIMDDFKRQIQGIKDDFKGLNQSLKRTGKTMSIALTAPILAGAGLATKGAIDAEAAQAKYASVFAGMTTEMNAWVNDMRAKFPIAKNEIIKLSSSLDDLLSPVMKNEEASKELTKKWMDLGGQIAAFNGKSMADVMADIQSASAGSAETLLKYGIVAKEANIQQKALEMGLIKSKEEMTDAIRQEALYALALESSSAAIEGFAEMQETASYKAQQNRAAIKDLADQFGNDLLPIFKDVMDAIRPLIEGFTNISPEMRRVIIIVGGLVAIIGPLLIGIASVNTALLTLSANPIVLTIMAVVLAIAALTAGFIMLYNRNEKFRNFVDSAWKAIKNIISGVWNSVIKPIFELWLMYIDTIIKGVNWIISQLNKIKLPEWLGGGNLNISEMPTATEMIGSFTSTPNVTTNASIQIDGNEVAKAVMTNYQDRVDN
jgi:hypothetical protein